LVGEEQAEVEEEQVEVESFPLAELGDKVERLAVSLDRQQA